MMGSNPKSRNGGIPGLYLLAAQDIFMLKEQQKLHHIQVGVSLFEIYMEKAFDLLNNRKECPVRVDDKNVVHIVGLSEQGINNVDSLMDIIEYGQTCRVTGKTSANEHSSRSHAILQIIFRNAQTNKQSGKMSFIDLAGNERAADTNSSNKQTMSDGAGINQSLLALKECRLWVTQASETSTLTKTWSGSARASSPWCSRILSSATPRPSCSLTSLPSSLLASNRSTL